MGEKKPYIIPFNELKLCLVNYTKPERTMMMMVAGQKEKNFDPLYFFLFSPIFGYQIRFTLIRIEEKKIPNSADFFSDAINSS